MAALQLFFLALTLGLTLAETSRPFRCSGMPTFAETNEDLLKKAAKKSSTFATNLFSHLSGNDSIVVSPLSLQLSMSLLLMGAAGKTAQEILNAIEGDSATWKKELEQLVTLSQDITPDTTEIILGSKIFVSSHGAPLKAEYLQKTCDLMDRSAEMVNFGDPSAENAINAWATEVPAQKIRDFVSPGTFNANTVAVLANVLSFEGMWLVPFNPAETINRPFVSLDGTQINIPTMFRKGKIRMRRDFVNKIHAVDLPYKNENVCLVLVMAEEGLQKAREHVATVGLDNMINSMDTSSQEVELTIPKFTIHYTTSLNEQLKKLGIDDLFTQQANLSGMVDVGQIRRPLYVDKVIQKAVFEISEEGTEAASATYVGIQTFSNDPSKYMNFNQPFLFFLIHKMGPEIPNNLVYFSGWFSGH